jgi:glycosyltransferase involved in cell wall biosynthesis
MITRVIIPAFNEENSVEKVIEEIPKNLVGEIIVVNNNSNDQTKIVAKNAGATVLDEPIPGYGRACLKGIEYVKGLAEKTDVIVFLDADYSDYPEEISFLLDPIRNKKAELVIGSRALGNKEHGSMTPQQVFGNWLATSLIKLLYNKRYSDLGPFRAITWNALMAIEMQDKTFGWTVEMQIKIAKIGLPYTEVPVNYKKRIGKSKISGTLKGTILAGYKIITTILKYR